jgi:hypothetical protein
VLLPEDSILTLLKVENPSDIIKENSNKPINNCFIVVKARAIKARTGENHFALLEPEKFWCKVDGIAKNYPIDNLKINPVEIELISPQEKNSKTYKKERLAKLVCLLPNHERCESIISETPFDILENHEERIKSEVKGNVFRLAKNTKAQGKINQ